MYCCSSFIYIYLLQSVVYLFRSPWFATYSMATYQRRSDGNRKLEIYIWWQRIWLVLNGSFLFFFSSIFFLSFGLVSVCLFVCLFCWWKVCRFVFSVSHDHEKYADMFSIPLFIWSTDLCVNNESISRVVTLYEFHRNRYHHGWEPPLSEPQNKYLFIIFPRNKTFSFCVCRFFFLLCVYTVYFVFYLCVLFCFFPLLVHVNFVR